MIVEKLIFAILLLALLASAGDDQLLKMGQEHSCIKQVISAFVANKNCDMLNDASKSSLALKMTECLLQQMGKALPLGCTSSEGTCKLEGDSWNTFSTFFAHIDNLCHFYWEMLHHQRAELLIGQLSQSSQNAELLLKRNALETQKILVIQQTMHESIEQSLMNQRQMTKLINNSARHISNLTIEMQSFVKRIHQDINENYGSVRNILNAMNEGLSQALSIQSYMTAQLTSIRGTLYFLSHFLIVLFITTFRRYSQARLGCLTILGANFLMEISFGTFVENYVGTHRFRYIFILLELGIIWYSDSRQGEFQRVVSIHLNTPRLKDVFKKAIMENEVMMSRAYQLSYYQLPQHKQFAKEKQILIRQSQDVQ